MKHSVALAALAILLTAGCTPQEGAEPGNSTTVGFSEPGTDSRQTQAPQTGAYAQPDSGSTAPAQDEPRELLPGPVMPGDPIPNFIIPADHFEPIAI